MLRAVKPIILPLAFAASPAKGEAPEPKFVDPQSLKIDGSYQRELSERSFALIKKIVKNWDWKKFKPPVVSANADGEYVIIDGQHTAIAAATHPDIKLIPVMVMRTDSVQEQADSFLGHNRDRVGINALQMHFAALRAGDAEAEAVDNVCKLSGLSVVRQPKLKYAIGETASVSTLRGLVKRHGVTKAADIARVAVEGKLAPVSVTEMRAIEYLLHDKVMAGQFTGAAISTVFIAAGKEVDDEAKALAGARGIPVWKAMGMVISGRAKGGKRRAA